MATDWQTSAGAEPAHPCCEHCAHANGYTHNEDCPACNDGGYICAKCDLPVALINGTWQHADAIACAVFSGNLR
jgi:hypothetical protein